MLVFVGCVVVTVWQGAEPTTTENKHTDARFHWLWVVVRAWQGTEPTTNENEHTGVRILQCRCVPSGTVSISGLFPYWARVHARHIS